jgi:hypothetical protein
LRHCDEQVAGLPEFLEVLEEEAVLSVVDRCPLGATLQEIIGQH